MPKAASLLLGAVDSHQRVVPLAEEDRSGVFWVADGRGGPDRLPFRLLSLWPEALTRAIL